MAGTNEKLPRIVECAAAAGYGHFNAPPHLGPEDCAGLHKSLNNRGFCVDQQVRDQCVAVLWPNHLRDPGFSHNSGYPSPKSYHQCDQCGALFNIVCSKLHNKIHK